MKYLILAVVLLSGCSSEETDEPRADFEAAMAIVTELCGVYGGYNGVSFDGKTASYTCVSDVKYVDVAPTKPEEASVTVEILPLHEATISEPTTLEPSSMYYNFESGEYEVLPPEDQIDWSKLIDQDPATQNLYNLHLAMGKTPAEAALEVMIATIEILEAKEREESI